MKIETRYVAPFSFSQRKYDELTQYIKKAKKEMSNYVSYETEKRVLEEFASLLAEFVDSLERYDSDQLKNINTIYYRYEHYDEIKKNNTPEFLARLEQLAKDSGFVAVGFPSTIVMFKDNKINKLPLSESMYKQGLVIDMREMSTDKKLETMFNLSKNNNVFLFNGVYDSINRNNIPLCQISALVDVEKSEIYENEQYKPQPSYTGRSADAMTQMPNKFNLVEFAVPTKKEAIIAEYEEGADFRIDITDDILYTTSKYFDNCFNESCINKPNNIEVGKDLLKILEHTNVVCDALEEHIISSNNRINEKLAEK